MTKSILDHIDRYWSAELGCEPEDFGRPQSVVVSHSIPGYQGVLVYRRGPSCVVSAPAERVEKLRLSLEGREPTDVFDAAFLASLFPGAVDRIIGPAYLGHVDGIGYRPADSRGTRRLEAEDEAALRRLAAACSPTEWEHSAVRFDRAPVFGCFVGAEIAAAGTLKRLDERMLSVGIVTHPGYRGQGYGKAVVSAMTEFGLKSGGILVYRTLSSNDPSVVIARSLGYQEYATTLAVRLR